MDPVPPPSNAFQRRYFAWAAPHYARMPEPLRHEAECLDRWLYSRSGVRFWACAAAAIVAGIVVLRVGGMSWHAAVPTGVAAGIAILLASLGAWLQPSRYTPAKLVRIAVLCVVLAWVGAFVGFVVARWVGDRAIDPTAFANAAGPLLRRAMPMLFVVVGIFLLLLWSIAAVKRLRTQKEVDALRIAHERDAIARQLAEARLSVLQRQIEPHFIFNTLAAVQHWVDRSDPRAGPLLRGLTAFLRGSTESLARREVAFGDELDTVRAYLTVMAARLGDRLAHVVDVDAAATTQALPPGLLLTLVENAIEHGVSPSVAGGTVTIDARLADGVWTLRVADDGVGLARGWRDGVGLANCRERLAHRFGDRAALALEARERGTVATVTIVSEVVR